MTTQGKRGVCVCVFVSVKRGDESSACKHFIMHALALILFSVFCYFIIHVLQNTIMYDKYIALFG